MYFDLNISESYEDFADLPSFSSVSGFCIAKTFKTNSTRLILPPIDKRVYSRVNLDMTQMSGSGQVQNTHQFNTIRNHFDVVSIKVESEVNSTIIKFAPDIVQIHNGLHIKKGTINSLRENNIFIEIVLVDALYKAEERIKFMAYLRRLIKLGAASILIISSGAKHRTEVKSPADICKLLGLFGISEDRAYKILGNTKRLLRQAALKTHTYRNMIGNDVGSSRLKEDFIMKYHLL